MPEGDTLHTIAAAMQPLLHGARLAGVEIAGTAMPELAAREVVRIWAHGKHLLVSLAPRNVADNGWVLRVHLGMFGSWHRYGPHERWRHGRGRASVTLRTARHVLVCFDAQDVDTMRPEAINRTMPFAHVGPDLLGERCDVPTILQRVGLLPADRLLVDVLLDQRVAAGIGNVYKSEILFIHRQHPCTRLGQVSTVLIEQMYTTAHTLLRFNVGTPRRQTTHVLPDVAATSRLFVYRRAPQPCWRCGTPIVRAMLGLHLRSTYWCPTCQNAGDE